MVASDVVGDDPLTREEKRASKKYRRNRRTVQNCADDLVSLPHVSPVGPGFRDDSRFLVQLTHQNASSEVPASQRSFLFSNTPIIFSSASFRNRPGRKCCVARQEARHRGGRRPATAIPGYRVCVTAADVGGDGKCRDYDRFR